MSDSEQHPKPRPAIEGSPGLPCSCDDHRADSDLPAHGMSYPPEQQDAFFSGYIWGQRSIVKTLLEDAESKIEMSSSQVGALTGRLLEIGHCAESCSPPPQLALVIEEAVSGLPDLALNAALSLSAAKRSAAESERKRLVKLLTAAFDHAREDESTTDVLAGIAKAVDIVSDPGQWDFLLASSTQSEEESEQ